MKTIMWQVGGMDNITGFFSNESLGTGPLGE